MLQQAGEEELGLHARVVSALGWGGPVAGKLMSTLSKLCISPLHFQSTLVCSPGPFPKACTRKHRETHSSESWAYPQPFQPAPHLPPGCQPSCQHQHGWWVNTLRVSWLLLAHPCPRERLMMVIKENRRSMSPLLCRCCCCCWDTRPTFC